MDPLELLELTDNLTDALDQLNTADPDDALAVLDAVEAVQAALEAMGESVQQTEPQPVAMPIASDYKSGGEYHLALRDWRNNHNVQRSTYSRQLEALNKKIKNAQARFDKPRGGGLVPPPIVTEARKNIESELDDLIAQRDALVASRNPVEPEATTNPLYQSVLDGAAVTIDLVKQVRAEGQKDPDHPQLRPAVRVIHGAVKAMAA